MATAKQMEEMAANMAGVTWAARALEVGEDTVRRWTDRGQLPTVRLSDGTRMYDMPTIQRIAEERRAKKAEGAK